MYFMNKEAEFTLLRYSGLGLIGAAVYVSVTSGKTTSSALSLTFLGFCLLASAYLRRERIGKITITLDTGCLNLKGKTPILNALEELEKKGIVELRQSDYTEPEFLSGNLEMDMAADNGLWKRYQKMSKEHTANNIIENPNEESNLDFRLFDKLKDIVFPRVNSLNKNQIQDLLHLMNHVQRGRDFFITFDTDFTKDGKQERLETIGIMARCITKTGKHKELITEITKLYKNRNSKIL